MIKQKRRIPVRLSLGPKGRLLKLGRDDRRRGRRGQRPDAGGRDQHVAQLVRREIEPASAEQRVKVAAALDSDDEPRARNALIPQ